VIAEQFAAHGAYRRADAIDSAMGQACAFGARSMLCPKAGLANRRIESP